jgi:hypothetical protein
MPRLAVVAAALTALVACAGAAWGLQKPGRTFVRASPITSLALTHGSVAFAVGGTKTDCDHVELWSTGTRGTWRFGRAHPCGDVPLFFGIGQIGVAGNRVVWVSYAGGNLTDWQLWTATSTSRTPRRLRVVERDTSDPAPVVVGPGTDQAVPYAVESEITWLGAGGTPVFRTRVPAEVRSITSGSGPLGWRVAALLDGGDVAVLDGNGALAATFPFAAGSVKWLGLAPAGLVVERQDATVEIHGLGPEKTVRLPAGAVVLDYADGRILYRVGQTFRLRTVGSGADTTLLEGSRAQRIIASLDPHGLAWAQGTVVSWACAACIGR